MECESMLFVTNHIPYLLGLSNSVSNSFIDFYSCEVVSSSDMRKNEAYSFDHFASIMATFNLLHASSCEMVTFCDILHETRQKTQTNSRECAERTSNLVNSTSLRVVFSTLSSLFGYSGETLSLVFDTILRNYSNRVYLIRDGSAELTIVISYPTDTVEKLFYLKRPLNMENWNVIIVKTSGKFPRALTISVDHGIVVHISCWLSQWKLLNCRRLWKTKW